MVDLAETIAPLLDAASRARHLRLLVRPGWAAADRAEGDVQGLELDWSAEAHAAVLALVQTPLRLPTGAVVQAVGDTLVLKQPPDTVWRAEDLSHEGWLSPMAARLLTAALATGRNILVTGPWALATQLIATLVNEGQRPALLGGADEALPRRWLQVDSAPQALSVGADRVAMWSQSPAEVVRAMGQLSGVMAWVEGRRLDRALMRFELGAEAATGRGNTPLHVLAGLDLLVVVSQQGGPRVTQIAEITLVEEGYRPNLIFLTGLPPAPSVLVPVAVPAFVDDLHAAGHTLLAEELRQVTPRARMAAAATQAAQHTHTAPPPAAAQPPPPPPRQGPPPVRSMRAMEVRQPRMTVEPPQQDHGAPGWELDRMPTPSGAAGSTPALTNAEDAAMAATYGLGPPPPPGGRGVAFSQVLKQSQGDHDLYAPDSDDLEDDAESSEEKPS